MLMRNIMKNSDKQVFSQYFPSPIRRLRCCDNCKRSFSEFKQVVNLKKSGLTFYIHEDELKQRNRDDTSNRRSIIVYNSGDKELNRYDYIIELCRYRTKCFRCTAIIQRIRSLLDNITSIKKYQILGLCDYCKRTNMRNKCKRCENIVNKFITNKVQECKDHEEIFTTWFYKVQRLLMSITQGELFCKHSIWSDYDLKTELDNLLKHLKSSLPVKQPFIEIYPDGICLRSSENKIINSKLILDELILKLKAHGKIGINKEQSFNNSATNSESSYCICKYLNKNETKSTLTQLFETLSVIDIPQSESQTLPIKSSSEDYKTNDLKDRPSKLPLIEEKEKNKDEKEVVVKKQKYGTTGDHSNINLTKQRRSSLKKKEKVKEQGKGLVEDQVDRETPMEKQNKVAKQETNDSKINVKEKQDSFQLMLNLIKERDKKINVKNMYKRPEKFQKFPMIADLPFLKDEVKTNVDIEDEASTIECSETREPEVTEMIKGNKIVPYHGSHYKDDKKKTPLLFQILANCTTPTVGSKQSITEDKTNQINQDKSEMDSRAGLIFYKLSDRKFIENGWTKLPTTKIMRRMNDYKIFPCNNESDWFKRNSEQKILFYDSGGKLAEVYENGCGKWFYENGDIALEYYKATDFTSGKRFIIYSSSEDCNLTNKKISNTILGCFDSLGNGVIYDHYGNIRLKYNQSEGLVVDKKIGPPGRWIWHTLNEPPVLQHVFVDTNVDVDPCLQEYVKKTPTIKEPNEEMILIELKNLMRERATKVLQKYKPFEIRMKVFKINNYFSLRIIDQSKIYVKFQCGRKCFKHNLGMIIKSDEIVDTKLVDFADVSTPYDRKVPQSESIVPKYTKYFIRNQT